MEQSNEKELFRLPKNVRQIGQVDTKIKLYVEDYVMTLFRQLARRSSMEYQMAVLLGKIKTSSNCNYIFISGAVEVHELMLTEDSEFTEDTWSGIYNQIKEYFKEEELLGWYLTRPGLIDVPDEKMTKIHEKNFPGDERVMILFDSLGERENLYITQDGDLKRIKGYFIYYEKNPNMQEYMIAQSENRSIENGYNDDDLMRKLRKYTNSSENTGVSSVKQKKGATRKWGYAVAVSAMILMVAVGVYAKVWQERDQKEQLAAKSEQTVPASSDVAATDKMEDTLKQLQGMKEGENNTAEEAGTAQSDLGDWERYEQLEDELKLPDVKQDTPDEQPENETDRNGEENTGTEQAAGGDTGKDEEEVQKGDGNVTDEPSETDDPVTETASEPEDIEKSDMDDAQIYIVKKGDTLASISMKMYQTMSKTDLIQKANNIEDIDLIFIGQKLVIPNP